MDACLDKISNASSPLHLSPGVQSISVRQPYFMGSAGGQNAVLHGRLFGQNWPSSTRAAQLSGLSQHRTSLPGGRTKSRTSWTPLLDKKAAPPTYPHPLPWVLSEPYFVDARPYIIPSEPYIVPSMPYIVAKSIWQLSESIAVRAPKTSIKLRKPIKTPAGLFQFWF